MAYIGWLLLHRSGCACGGISTGPFGRVAPWNIARPCYAQPSPAVVVSRAVSSCPLRCNSTYLADDHHADLDTARDFPYSPGDWTLAI